MNDDFERLVTPPEHDQWSFRQKAVYWIIFLGGMAALTWVAKLIAPLVVNPIVDFLWPG